MTNTWMAHVAQPILNTSNIKFTKAAQTAISHFEYLEEQRRGLEEQPPKVEKLEGEEEEQENDEDEEDEADG